MDLGGEWRLTDGSVTVPVMRPEGSATSFTVVTAPRAGTEVVLAWEPPSFSIPGARHAAE